MAPTGEAGLCGRRRAFAWKKCRSETWRWESEAAAGVVFTLRSRGHRLRLKQEPHLGKVSPRTRLARQGPGAGGTSPPPGCHVSSRGGGSGARMTLRAAASGRAGRGVWGEEDLGLGLWRCGARRPLSGRLAGEPGTRRLPSAEPRARLALRSPIWPAGVFGLASAVSETSLTSQRHVHQRCPGKPIFVAGSSRALAALGPHRVGSRS